MMRKTRVRSVGAASAFVVTMLVATACGGSSSASSSSSVVKNGDSVTIGLAQLPPTQGNPFGATYSGPSGEVWTAIFDALTDPAPADPTPSLATSWKLTSPTTWEFNLRQGVKFSDGEDFNAAAAAATFNYLLSPAGSSTAIGAVVQGIATVTVVSPYVLDLTTKQLDPILPREIDQVNMVAPNAWQSLGPAKFALKPVGTGPYQVSQWGPTEVSLANFDGSWRAGHYNKLTFTQIANGTSRYQAVQSGQIQVDYDLLLQQITGIKSQTNLSLLQAPAGKVFTMQFLDKQGSPLLNKQVRQALNMAVDREAYITAIFNGLTTAAYQGASPGDNGYDKDLPPIKYDPAKAKSLLAQAGYPNGFSFEVDVAPASVPGDDEMWEAVTADLAKIGVTVKVVTLPFATWLANFLGAKFTSEAASAAYSDAPSFDASAGLTKGSCLQKPAVDWCQQDQVPLLQQIATTTDSVARNKLFDQLQVMERDNPPALFLYNIVNATAISKSVHTTLLPDGAIDYSALAPA